MFTLESLKINPILSKPAGVEMRVPRTQREDGSKIEAPKPLNDKEKAFLAALYGFLGTEYATRSQVIAFNVAKYAKTSCPNFLNNNKTQSNHTTRPGLYRIPIEVLPKELVREIKAKQSVAIKELRAAEAVAKTAAAAAKKTEPKPAKTEPKTAKKTVKPKKAKAAAAAAIEPAIVVDPVIEAITVLEAVTE